MKLKTLPIFFAFLAMGFADAAGPFVGQAKEQFELSNFVAQLIPFTVFIMFGLLSVPMGIFQDKTGKKTILMLGLGLALAGVIIPTISVLTYEKFLVTVLLLGAGAATLQVAGNPIMRDVSEDGKYSRNLSIAQFVKAIGSLMGPVILATAAYFGSRDMTVVFTVFSGALIVSLLLVSLLKVNETKSETKTASLASCAKLLGNNYVLMMVLAIFMYVGAEVCISSGIPMYLQSAWGLDLKTYGMIGSSGFLLGLTIGRFLGSVILNWLSPKVFFVSTAVLSILGILGLFSGIQIVSLASVLVIGLGFANIFPLVFSIAVDSMPERSNELSGLMITAIVGGAIVPPLMGLVADKTSVLIGFTVPLMAILYITYTALAVRKAEA